MTASTPNDPAHDAPHARADRDLPGQDAPGHDAPGRDEAPDAGAPADGDGAPTPIGGGAGDGGHPQDEGRPPHGSAGPRIVESEDDPSSAATTLARIAQAAPPRPPRRTGVFLDSDDLREHVGSLLRTILGGYEVDAFGNYTFTHENARIFVTVGPSPIGPQVGVFSVTNLDLDLTPDLAGFLLHTNHTLGFGAFSYDGANRSVWLRHTLLGTTLDGPELQSAVAAIATTAARLDQPIRDRFGGRTFADAPDDVQRTVEPPTVDPDGPRSPNASGYL